MNPEDIETTAENDSVIDSTKETTDAEHIETTAENESVIGKESKNSPTSENTKKPAFVNMVVVPNTMEPPPARNPESPPYPTSPSPSPPPPAAAASTPAEDNSLNSKRTL